MQTQLLKRALIGICCAVLLVAAVAVVNAAPPQQDSAPVPGSEECVGCHEGLRSHWETGSHGQAAYDPIFQESWEEKGNPPECLTCHTTGFDPATGDYHEEGVACLACHYPIVPNHPEQYMPTDVSSRLCGTCHLDTFDQWEDSTHATQDLTCDRCHNPHTTEIRMGSAQDLCSSCHATEAEYYALTAHAAEGLTCADCHLTVEESVELGEGHGIRKHTFEVDMSTCNGCHETDMHAAAATMPLTALDADVACYPTESVHQTAVATDSPELHEQPQPASPLVYFLPAGIGLVFGMLFAPWMENWYRRISGGK